MDQEQIRQIVIDPGHGGDDPGSRGASGALEKDVVLELARATEEALRRGDYAVHLTRTEDRAVTLRQRAALANYWAADLFVSLHASGLGRPHARGFELMVSPDPGPRFGARLWAGGQVGRWGQSHRLAELLRSALSETLPTFDRGITELPNPVLESVSCPSCLVEVANLAWASDEEALRSPSTRAALASAIAKAVDAFFKDQSREDHETRRTNSHTAPARED